MQTPAANLNKTNSARENRLSLLGNSNFDARTSNIFNSEAEQLPASQIRSSGETENGVEATQYGGSKPSFSSLLERCKSHIKKNIPLHLRNSFADVLDTTKDIRSVVDSRDWTTIVKFLRPQNEYFEIDNIPLELWVDEIVRNALLDIISTWSEEKRYVLEERLSILFSCLDAQQEKQTSSLFSLLHKALKQNRWVKPTSEFSPIPGERPGGSAPEMQFFRDSEGNRWLGKCGSLALYEREVLLWENRDKLDFISPYADEILEKLGIAIYELVGVKVPQSVLSYQWVTEEVKEEFGCDSPRLHYLSRWIDNFHTLGPDFVADYLKQAKRCGNSYVKIKTEDGQELPLKGLGAMLAAADFLYDLDCIGNQGGNAGYVIAKDEQTGKPYAQLVKIDAGYAFSYYSARYDQGHDPRKRTIRIRPDEGMLEFANLAPADQKEFSVTAKRMLNIPRETYGQLFLRAEEIEEGIPKRHSQAMLDGLIARKNLFLKAFASETDRAIVEEIEAAQIRVAKKLEAPEEISREVVEELLAQEKEESKALAQMRVRLAVLDAEQSEPKKLGECKTFQLPTTSTHFIGRKEVLAEVVKQLSQKHGSVIRQSISGIGGVGKTQLALHYAQAAVKGEAIAGEYLSYDHVVWLNAEVFLEGQFQALAELWTGAQLKANEATEAVYRYLRDKRALLVFDNAENARSIAGFLPPAHYTSSVHLLITSRSGEWGEIPTVKLGGFSLEEAQEYVGHHLGSQPKETVAKLVELLGGLPLAMSQAVSYIKAGHSTLESFEEQFYLNQANLLSHELLEEEEHPKTVGTTLTLCLAQAKVRSSLVEKLLGVVAYLAADGIRVELVERALERSKEEVEQALEVLESYSLVSRGSMGLQVHRLVQEVMRQRQSKRKDRYECWDRVVEVLSQVVVWDKKALEKTRSSSYAIEHVKQAGDLWRRERARNREDRSRENEWGENQNGLSREQELKLSELLEVSGLHQQTVGNYGVAKELQSQALEIRETYYGLEHLEVASTLGNLGNAYGALGDARKQKELLERALRIEETHYGPDHVEVARTLVNLGNAYGDLGDARKQKEMLERGLRIKETHYGSHHAEVASTLVNLGNAYGALGNARRQKELLQRALCILETHYGPDHVEVARTLGNLGNAYGALGDARKKKEVLERALCIQETHYGPDHVVVASTLTNLGNAYGALGDARKQKEQLERALRIQETHYGAEHVEVAITLTNLGNAYGALGDARKKKELLERALCIQETHYGADHVEVARTLGSLGNVYGALGDARKKKEQLERALCILETHYGPDHVEVARTLGNLGNAYGALGDARKQKDLLERALRIKETHYGAEHVEVAIPLTNLGNAYGTLGDARKQKELLERALRIQETHYGPDHMEVAITLCNLALAYLSLEEVAMAIDCAQRVVEIRKHHFNEAHPAMQRARDLLKYCMAEKYSVKGSASKSPTVPHVAEQIQEEEERFIASVEGWVEHVEEAIRGRGDKNYESHAAASFVGTALQVLRRGMWQHLEQAPEDYGIPAELLEDLKEYKQANEEVLQLARTHEELAKRVYSSLLIGERLDVRAGQIEQRASAKQEEEEGEKEANPKPFAKEDDSKRCVVS